MTTQNGRAFNEWLRAQLKAKKMSQRQLAQQSGVDHSTISRLIRGDRMPSLGTATKLARGLRELHDDADTPAVPRGGVRDAAKSDRSRRVRAARRRPADRAAGPPDHGVLPRRPDAPVRPGVLADDRRWRHGRARRPERSRRRAQPPAHERGPRGHGRGLRRPPGEHPRRASARHARSSARRRGPRVATSSLAFPGHDPDRPPRPGLGDSECRPSGRHSPCRGCGGVTGPASCRRSAALPPAVLSSRTSECARFRSSAAILGSRAAS